MKKNTIIVVIIAIGFFLVGFFAGQEYLKYQIKTSITEGLQNAFGNKEKQKEERTTVNKVLKTDTVIAKGENHTFSKGEKEQIRIKVREVKNYGKKMESGNRWERDLEGQNNIIVVRLESKNIGKKPTFKSISEYSALLITEDGVEFRPIKTKQVSDRPDGYGGCIACESNPGEKNVEDIIFDIKSEQIKNAKIKIDEDDKIRFQL